MKTSVGAFTKQDGYHINLVVSTKTKVGILIYPDDSRIYLVGFTKILVGTHIKQDVSRIYSVGSTKVSVGFTINSVGSTITAVWVSMIMAVAWLCPPCWVIWRRRDPHPGPLPVRERVTTGKRKWFPHG